MNESRDRTAGRSDPGRAVAFSDGIFAIIITLLVLDLATPDVEPSQLLSGLLEQWSAYLAYLTSYLYVAVVWLNHKGAFKRIHPIDRGLNWANIRSPVHDRAAALRDRDHFRRDWERQRSR